MERFGWRLKFPAFRFSTEARGRWTEGGDRSRIGRGRLVDFLGNSYFWVGGQS
ncbi:uncharacterized protein MYCGRDRAFT_104171 [Zymoseptoria tritici IPO323]|uniref:Uncharacterized protein n=1 Tax=Zymoseptoria tritici (strain CBS 115943 / IPO323) TaxID=336722 RepID=F9X8E1_ZYMTI|nr:uncharacterized protein MYCGRDRAFT_104171 [Zymoseptoria tritici IPO323]EGP88380.1 hypothetical protein MYCGRDRAFT_104171 [Zymoseptoria tritici IPO323]